MPRPARKSSRNASKGPNENGQEQDIVVSKNRSRSPTPESEKIRERTRSGSSSSSRSKSPDKTSRGRRGRAARGKPKNTGKRRSQRARKDSSSSSASSEEIIPKKKNRRSTNSKSSRSRSKSPKPVSSKVTRRTSNRRSSASLKSVDTDETKEDCSGDSQQKAVVDSGGCHDNENNQSLADTSDDKSASSTPAHKKESERTVVVASESEKDSRTVLRSNEEANSQDTESVLKSNVLIEDKIDSTQFEEKKSTNRLSRWKSSKSKSPGKDVESEKLVESPLPDGGDVRIVQQHSPQQEESMNVEMKKDEPKHASPEEPIRKVQTSDSSPSRSSVQRRRSSSRSRSRSSSSGSTTDTGAMDEKLANINGSRKVVSATIKEIVPPTDTPVIVEEKKHDSPNEEPTANKENIEKENANDNGCSKDIVQQSEDMSSKKDDESKSTEDKDTNDNLAVTGIEEEQNEGKSEQEEKFKKEKGVKKRKWGSKTSKAGKTTKRMTSMEISSDSLKGLIGEVKLTESVFDMETEVVNTLDYEPEEDRRDIKVKRTIVQDVQQDSPKEMDVDDNDARTVEARDDSPSPVRELTPPPSPPSVEAEKKIIKITSAAPKEGEKKLKESKKGKKKKEEAVKDKETEVKKIVLKEKERVIATTRPVIATTRPAKSLLPTVDEPLPVGEGSKSPARNPVDRVIRIACLVRPFTVRQLKELLKRNGELDEKHFYINDIKSHCLAAFINEEDAVKARSSLHGTRWPQSNPKILVVDFATIEDIEHRNAEGAPLPPKKQEDHKIRIEKKEEEDRKRVREQREKEREVREKEEKENRETDRQRRREPEKKNPVREWDRDKIKQLSRSRSRSKEAVRATRPARSNSRDRERQKRRERSREKKDEDRRKEKKQKDAKAEEEPPAKLLDDLFRKTKATPCIYWLPLTEEQSLQRQIKQQEEEKERQKRRAAQEGKMKEEEKKREALRLERQRMQREREKEREKERARSRDKSRDKNRGRQERAKSSGSRSRSRSRRRR